MSDEVRTVTVPHLGTSTIGYEFGKPYDASLPTLVMVNSFSTSVELYRPQFAHTELSETANLLAIEDERCCLGACQDGEVRALPRRPRRMASRWPPVVSAYPET